MGDSNNHVIRKITSAAAVTTFAGTAGFSGFTDATGSAARFNEPRGIAVDSGGTLWVADQANHVIRKITSAAVVTTFAGTAGYSGSTDGTGSAARFFLPFGIAVDSGGGTLWVVDQGNHLIRRITSAAVVTTFAGGASGTYGTIADGTGSAARLWAPAGIAVDSEGTLWVAEFNSNVIRKITSAAVVTTFAGTAGSSGSTDGTGSAARFNAPTGIAVDSGGTLWVADWNSNVIRKITPAAVVTTFAGAALCYPCVTGSTDGTGSAARFNGPVGVAVDSAGTLWVLDNGNSNIRKITTPVATSTLQAQTTGCGSVLGVTTVEGVQVYCDGAGWAMIQNTASPCSFIAELATVQPGGACGYRSASVVRTLSNAATVVRDQHQRRGLTGSADGRQLAQWHEVDQRRLSR